MPDGGRVGPDTKIRFQGKSGAWTDAHAGRELRVDRDGVYVAGHGGITATTIEIAGISPEVATKLYATKPDNAELAPVGDHYLISASRDVMPAWLAAFELAVARLDPIDDLLLCGDAPEFSFCPGGHIYERTLTGDDAKLFTLEVTHRGAALGKWRLHGAAPGEDELAGRALVDALNGRTRTWEGWRWRDIQSVELWNLNGPKTIGAVIGYTLLVLWEMSIPFHRDITVDGPPGPEKGTWSPEVDATASPRPLFTTGARVRDRFAGSIVLDSSVALHGDLIGTGAVARIRLAEVVELGGGVRVDDVRGHGVSTTGLFQIGLRMPLGERDRFALPIGFEVGGGGAVDVDLRFPWGLRAMAGRWSVALEPATPQYLHVEGEPRRWSIASGVELGASF